MSYETIRLDVDARGVAQLTLNRPEKHNAMSALMISELAQAAAQLAVDQNVRVVVLTGTGTSFCAGGDLGWMRDQMAADAATRAKGARALAMMLKALNDLPKPLIGRAQGNAFGGGVGLMSVCDIVFTAETARFGLTETKLGLIPATIGPYVVARMGEGAVRQVFMSGKLFDANRAKALGLVAGAYSSEGLDEAVAQEVAAYLACAPGAVADAKALVAELAGTVTTDAIDHSIAALVARWETPESQEGISAFFDRRPAQWAND